MAKRFTDINRWKSPFVRGLQGPYKLLWFYINDDCDHAGIWNVDIEVAELRIGENVTIDAAETSFAAEIIKISNELWFIPSFIEYQYGELNPMNRVHQSVILLLKKHKIDFNDFTNKNTDENKVLISPLQGVKNKNKNKNINKIKNEGGVGETFSDEIVAEIAPSETDSIEPDEIPKVPEIPADHIVDEEEFQAAKKYLQSQSLFTLIQMQHQITKEDALQYFERFYNERSAFGELGNYKQPMDLIKHFFRSVPFYKAKEKELENISTGKLKVIKNVTNTANTGHGGSNGVIKAKNYGKL
ncbi:MAG: hypothetical protein J7577_13425 [Sphingobacteriaceae bacterium]|nr:hypothetical protein [Sphingobacteriaceae bacterium]